MVNRQRWGTAGRRKETGVCLSICRERYGRIRTCVGKLISPSFILLGWPSLEFGITRAHTVVRETCAKKGSRPTTISLESGRCKAQSAGQAPAWQPCPSLKQKKATTHFPPAPHAFDATPQRLGSRYQVWISARCIPVRIRRRPSGWVRGTRQRKWYCTYMHGYLISAGKPPVENKKTTHDNNNNVQTVGRKGGLAGPSLFLSFC